MLSIFISTMFFSIDHQSTSNDRLKPVLTTGLVNMHIDRSIANLGGEAFNPQSKALSTEPLSSINWATVLHQSETECQWV